MACGANLKPKAAPVITSLSLPKSFHPVLMSSGPSGSLKGSETSSKCFIKVILRKKGKDYSSFPILLLFLLFFPLFHFLYICLLSVTRYTVLMLPSFICFYIEATLYLMKSIQSVLILHKKGYRYPCITLNTTAPVLQSQPVTPGKSFTQREESESERV